jgi:Zn finger protein HypA/HybF involved in hydrogenase expression
MSSEYTMPYGPSQLYRDGEPQIYCADCFYYGDARTFPGDTELDIVQCPACGKERIFALSKAKKDQIDALED